MSMIVKTVYPNYTKTPASILEDPKVLKSIAKYCPISYAKFFGRKYILPHYREGDYYPLDFQNLVAFDRCLAFAVNPELTDDVVRCAIANTLAALEYNRPTLYLEKELGEALLRTSILADMSSGDIHWRWPAFKIVLPKGLISIEREGSPRSLTHFDVCHIGPEPNIRVDPEIAREIEKFIARLSGGSAEDITRFNFLFKKPGLCISTALDRPDHAAFGQTAYGVVKPWGDIRLGDYRAVSGSLATAFPSDDVDQGLLNRLEHLVLNVLLFLSATPLEYTPEHILRKPRTEGSRLIPGLLAARFVGQCQLRPIREEAKTVSAPTGRQVAGHWVCGAWRRVAYGPKATLRRLQWIQPYRTHDPEEREPTGGLLDLAKKRIPIS
jgi:hypothetical protein